ncbi:MAG: CYTH domain-containing protein [Anaerolineaceae bacterium]|jgi:adenylate cyclase class 2|nr:MAG: CYTH domain-containing protein [Anaerolineaceae bacterium]
MHTNDNHEKEVKFFLTDFNEISTRLFAAGAILQKERVHEYNYRFDTSNQKLRNHHQVLRLRQDKQAHLTFKGSSDFSAGITDRQELEITVSDFESTKKILEALGFMVFMIYEKYRTTYRFRECEIVLDELPFGSFMEIEGFSADSIRSAAEELGLNWEKRITLSYLELFHTLKVKKNLQMNHILFESFEHTSFVESDFFPEAN